MIKFSNYLKEEKQVYVPSLDDIERSVFSGKFGVDKSISLISEYLDRNKTKISDAKYVKIKNLLYNVKVLNRDIPSGILNRIAISDTIGEHIRKYDSQVLTANKKIPNVSNHVINLNDFIVQRINREIIHSVRQDTRINREKEKNEVIKFFRSNLNTLVKMYELYNTLIDIKDALNEKN